MGVHDITSEAEAVKCHCNFSSVQKLQYGYGYWVCTSLLFTGYVVQLPLSFELHGTLLSSDQGCHYLSSVAYFNSMGILYLRRSP
jgi:hypothetical protein